MFKHLALTERVMLMSFWSDLRRPRLEIRILADFTYRLPMAIYYALLSSGG